MSSIRDHLLTRGMDPDRPGIMLDEVKGLATFLVFNLSGIVCGFQQYNPNGKKAGVGDIELNRRHEAKYYTHAGYEGDEKRGKRRLMVWGLETVVLGDDRIFVCEGIFDAVKLQNCGLPAVACLGNDPQPLRPFFAALGRWVIGVLDDDSAGGKLAKFVDEVRIVPRPFHDLGDMPQADVDAWVRKMGWVK